MTSSLVGSEMCIRDSRQSGLDDPNPQSLAIDLFLHSLPLQNPSSTSEPCLLYTSDAADDM
eukprot:4757119-Prorocentrum_lima.AAC.1